MFSLTKNPAVRYFLESRDELKRVAWPTPKQTYTYSGFVVGICLALAAYFAGIDQLLTVGLQALVRVTSGT